MNIIGIAVCVAVLAGALVLAGRWVWHRIPHQAAQESEILHRLSEIVMALKVQNEILNRPNTELGIQTGLLLDVRTAAKDPVEVVHQLGDTLVATTNPAGMGPMLDALREINEHLFADVASRAQIDETIGALQGEGIAGNLQRIADILAQSRAAKPDVVALIARLDELQLFLHKQHASTLVALDALVLDFGKFQKQQANFMNALFNSGSITTVDDAESANLEKIDALTRRYGISRELAEERVRGSAVYEPNTGRGMRGGV